MIDPRRKRQDGIRTLDDLQGRCVIDRETLCWIWRGAVFRNAAGSDTTRVWLPDADGKGRVMTAPRAAWILSGRKLPAGHIVWRARCHCSALCISPQHGAAGTRQDMFAAFVRDGRLRGDPRSAVINARNRMAGVVPLGVVRQAEAMFAAGALQKEVKAALGISHQTAAKIRKGIHPHSAARGVKVVANASVFTWRAAA